MDEEAINDDPNISPWRKWSAGTTLAALAELSMEKLMADANTEVKHYVII